MRTYCPYMGDVWCGWRNAALPESAKRSLRHRSAAHRQAAGPRHRWREPATARQERDAVDGRRHGDVQTLAQQVGELASPPGLSAGLGVGGEAARLVSRGYGVLRLPLSGEAE
ncbi:hypothetical protein SAV14893_074910 [Streptomyces avermitilis]|uniref:Uncharacterized protein n=1 Tax=Streptomyces avermitilis TaxID=33903 RepID=A0A4D4M8E2_STRAX|nr:hypothetical protein SAVMC3_87840 [Streptomyces avermitilis]GDY68098.1 hypothetical protein SAV14893_074910 [Streptomyces avermitilis]GDY71562.1 hypothetical protein SAV31267_010470 [Streptomyces avermitilis]